MSVHPFATLSPDLVLDAVESAGFISDARVLALNSYENRVYQVGIEGELPIIAKFYRPERWTDAQIIEAPEPGDLDQLYRLGQLLGRMHAVGSSKPFKHRPELNVDTYGHASFERLRAGEHVPKSLRPAWESVVSDLLIKVDQLFAEHPYTPIRIHADCHPGNLLCRDDSFFIVDLDDCRMGPAVQDLWMMLEGSYQERLSQLSELIDGYQQFYDFSTRELPLIEGLRALRLLHYSAWLAQRWDDPAFPMSFPWFGTENYWGEQILILREQRAALDEPYLTLF